MLKLPKDVVADPRHDEVLRLLTESAAPLWEGGKNRVPTVPLTPGLAGVLRRVLSADLGTQGLEQIERDLAGEQKGLDAVAARSPAGPPSPRVSRILFVADDGSERFYRDCDRLLTRHAQRLIGCRVLVSGEGLGEAIFGQPNLVRAVLIADKKESAQALFAMCP